MKPNWLIGVARVPVTPLLQAFFNQTTYKRWRKCHDDILAIVFNQSIDEIINTFATRHSRRVLLKDILKDEQWELSYFVGLSFPLLSQLIRNMSH